MMITWNKCRKKPVVVDNREVIGDIEVVKTREGYLKAYRDKDFIIRGVEGELYPIKKTIFFKTYDIIGD